MSTLQEPMEGYELALADDGKTAGKEPLEAFARGENIGTLAHGRGHTKGKIHRLLVQELHQRVMEERIEYFHEPQFEEESAEEYYFRGQEPEGLTKALDRVSPPKDLPPYLQSLYGIPLLSPEGERYLFSKFNYLKYRASRLREELGPHPSLRKVRKVEEYLQVAKDVKQRLVQSNLRLVVSRAKKYGPDRFEAAIDEGNMTLMRAVEKFQVARGFKFSTYVTWAIIRNCSKALGAGSKRKHGEFSNHDDALATVSDNRSTDGREGEMNALRSRLEQLFRDSNLNGREVVLLRTRFGLDDGEGKTLEEVGRILKVTKERARQLQGRAMEKVTQWIDDHALELEDFHKKVSIPRFPRVSPHQTPESSDL